MSEMICTPDAVGQQLLRGYGVTNAVMALIPSGSAYQAYEDVEAAMSREGAARLIAEHGRGEGLRRFATQRVIDWALRRSLLSLATRPKPTCGHCGGVQDGYAAVGNLPLCHPNTGMDCFKLVTLYGHGAPCSACQVTTASSSSEGGEAQ